MRRLFEFLSLFDWITPAVNIAETVVNDPTPLQSNSWTFFVPYQQALKAGYNGRDIEQLFKRSGIYFWGSQITNGEFFCSVRLDQARQAEELLQRHGIPLKFNLPDGY
jgi:hypothetical protein